ncbi:helix-turn-helix transcriptional regulator [Tardiphaga sp. P9-11]|uniref:helix-turn-helix domain-containing protein n=1 Tax=Tardiphaga sp. P9-11 TaxID=2024614 RepID=UPI0011F2B8BA|nr:helix-turn-helix transcriptional regulator [Tardiphaga sp. P9-11]KAA0074010.1 XRE family transcriptional regulator [Tardiphaga sp. P9-11]
MKLGQDQDVSVERRQGKPVPEARQLRKQAGDWLKARRADAGLSQVDLAARLGLKYYTFISQVENGFSRVPTETMEAWAIQLGLEPAAFAKYLLVYYEPELHRLLFGASK